MVGAEAVGAEAVGQWGGDGRTVGRSGGLAWLTGTVNERGPVSRQTVRGPGQGQSTGLPLSPGLPQTPLGI